MMKKRIAKFGVAALAMSTIVSASTLVQAEEIDYENKELWTLETDNIAWCNYTSMYDHMAAMGLADNGFDIDAYVNSKMGEGVIGLLKNVILYQETDQEVMDYWADLGIRKELFNAEDANEKFAVYTPESILAEENSDNTYPIVFCLHGGGNPIFAAESYGYAQLGATEKYITVMPEDCSIENIDEIMEFLRENYPIDESRIYSVGLSAGGNRSYMNATSEPELFAAITACGQPVLFNGTSTPEELSEIGGVAVYNIVGQYDAFQHYPFTIDGFKTSDEKIEGFNQWMEANNLVYEELLTKEKIEELYGKSEDVVLSNTGVDFPITYTFEADGTDFWTGEYLNEDGINTFRVSMVEDGLHWTTASYAELSWNYMKHFSRDPETKELVYVGENPEVEKIDYEKKDLWTKDSSNYVTFEGKDDSVTTTKQYLNYGSEKLDMDVYLNSELGKNEIELFENYINYTDPMDEEVLAYWENLGVRKEMHDEETPESMWAAYVPEEVEEGEQLPVVFVFHGNTNSVWVSETYGFAQYGAEARYITIIPEASNGDTAVDEFDRIMTYLKENDYPIDESRVYATGFSKGGYSSQNLANTYPNRIAAIAIGGNPAVTSEGFLAKFTPEQMEVLTEVTMPIMDYAGYYDFNLYPLNEKSKLEPAEEKIDGLNFWLKASGAVAEELTMEHSKELSETSEDITKKLTGVDFTKTEVRELDGTKYNIGTFQNEDGVTVFEGLIIEQQMHWPAPSSAELCWEFLSQFSRDTETGELIVNK